MKLGQRDTNILIGRHQMHRNQWRWPRRGAELALSARSRRGSPLNQQVFLSRDPASPNLMEHHLSGWLLKGLVLCGRWYYSGTDLMVIRYRYW